MRHTSLLLLYLLAATVSVQAQVVIETVTVGNPGNAGELSGECVPAGEGPCRECGAVDYVYDIGKFEVTAGQYTEFLNAVAGDDSYGLYSRSMGGGDPGVCMIQRGGSPGSYSYTVAANWADRPVNLVTWSDAVRFANWLHNGQPTGAQDAVTTEDGSYDLSATHPYYGPDGVTDFHGLQKAVMTIVRELDATWVIPSEDEWYKAAYHFNDGATGNYWDYPTGSDAVPNNGNPEGDTGNTVTFYDGDYTIGAPYWRTNAGQFTLSGSPYGTFDQGGNVWERNEAVIGEIRGARAGGFFHYADHLHAAWRGYDRGPEHAGESEGFRVAKVAEPACARDCDGDGDVDLYDYALWQRAFTGPR